MKQLFSTTGNTNHKAVIHEKRETHEISSISTLSFLHARTFQSAAHRSEAKREISSFTGKRKQISVFGATKAAGIYKSGEVGQ